MSNYQAVPCRHCRGDGYITIADETTGHRVNKYSIFFSYWVYANKNVKCGICNGQGYVAIDLEKLEKWR